jgi:dipeptidyl aminopeptidase/acylaminoacyl peptidase
MPQMRVHACFLVLMTTLFSSGVDGALQLRPLTIEDCVGTRRIVDGEVKISPDGSFVAYVVKSPDIVTNRNNYQLFIRDLRDVETRNDGRLVLQGDKVSEIRWIGSEKIAAHVEHAHATEPAGSNKLTIVDVNSGKQETLIFPTNTRDYDISPDGKSVVYSVAAPEDSSADRIADSEKVRELRGYRVPFGRGLGYGPQSSYVESELYIGKIMNSGIEDSRRLEFDGPAGLPHRSELKGILNLHLAPNGKHLLFTYIQDTLPEEWQGHPLLGYEEKHGALPIYGMLGLYDLESHHLNRAFNSVQSGFYTKVSWASDSSAFAVVGASPIDTPEGKAEAREAIASGNAFYYLLRFGHVFSVDVRTGRTSRVLSRDSGVLGISRFANDTPLWWSGVHGKMLVRSDAHEFVWMSRDGEDWTETGKFEVTENGNFLSSFTSDGHVLAGISQSVTIPPNLFAVDLKGGPMSLLTNLNPDYINITLGQVERIEWTNRYGSHCRGKLIKPVNYVAGKRYPLVIMASNFQDDYFVSDSLYTTAFAPQSLANAGFLVLMAKYSDADNEPTGQFPGGMAFAYDWMSMQESAIDLLADRGLADKNNVGIVGFSRTSWLTDFTLTHSTYEFAAASSADGATYTYSGYFRENELNTMNVSEVQMGGPPYGDSFSNWLEYAPPFNAGRVRAPVLMEYTGDVSFAFEFFVALARQGKAVELYSYPKGSHPLDTPFERLASLQRNVDWFRFWMQGFEGKAPDYDLNQYVRWRLLRQQQEWNEQMRRQGKDPSAEFLRQAKPGAALENADPEPIGKN